MLDCLIMGDSIAVGVSHAQPKCVAYAKGGINSKAFNETYVKGRKSDFGAEVVIISLGSNDGGVGVKTYNELYKLREHVKAERVYWVLPNPERFPRQADDVNLIAISFGDQILKTNRYQEDKVHPTVAGYKELAKSAE